MGCDQSRVNKPQLSPARVERIITIEPQKVIDPSGRRSSRKQPSANSYQGVQGHRINMSPAELQETLEEYKECEESIHQLEKDDPILMYYIKKSHLESIEDAAAATQEKIDNLLKAIQNGDNETTNNGRNLKKVVLEYGNKDIVSKVEQEYLTSANRLEIAITELEMLHQEKALVESEVSGFKTICTKLIAYYKRQDDISKKLTMSIANPQEAKLYKHLADVESKKIKISETYQRWKEGRSQISDTCHQFSSALKKWREIKDDTPAKLYDRTEECRDDLVTALACIINARFYIKSELPYCSKTEMAVLEKALSYIFIDMNTAERRLHADTCYTAFHNRAVALYAWIDMTIKTVIEPEIKKVADELNDITKKVRDVRFQTIQKQFPDVTWKTTEEDETDGTTTNTLTDEESLKILAQLDISQLAQFPLREEIYGKYTANADYKSMFKDSFGNEIDDPDQILQVKPDEILTLRKESITKNVVHEKIGAA